MQQFFLHGTDNFNITYDNHFYLFKFINFNSKVTEIRFLGGQETIAYQSLTSGKPVWEVVAHNTKSDTIQVNLINCPFINFLFYGVFFKVLQ